MPLHEAQIIQETLERIRVLYVPADGFTAASGEQLVRAIQERVGSVEVILEEVNADSPREERQVPRGHLQGPDLRSAAAVEVHAN